MAATSTIGQVSFNVDLDGKTLPAQARAEGEIIGNNLGKGIDSTLSARFKKLGASLGDFGRSLTKNNPQLQRFRKNISGLGADILTRAYPAIVAFGNRFDRLTDSFSRARAKFGTSGNLFTDLGNSIGRVTLPAVLAVTNALSRLGPVLSRARANFSAARIQLGGFGATLRSVVSGIVGGGGGGGGGNNGGLAGGMNRASRAFRDTTNASEGLNNSFRRLPHGARQFLFYVTLFASLATQIAVLGSAAGSGLFVLAASLGALGLGLVTLLIGFKGFTKAIDKIAPAAQPAVKALRDLFHQIHENVQTALFTNIAVPLGQLASTVVPLLNKGLVLTASTLNKVFTEIVAGLASANGVATLNTLFAGFQPVLLALVQAAEAFGASFGRLNVIALPFVQGFATALKGLGDQFLAFTKSADGTQQITEFFADGAHVIQTILPLLSATAHLLNSLVTPETIKLFDKTIGFLTSFMTPLTDIGLAIGDLDPIGLIAQALAQLGEAIQPSLPALDSFAKILSGALSSAIAKLAPMVGDLLGALAPLLPIIAELAGQFLSDLIPALQPFVDLLVQILPTLRPLILELGAGLQPLLLTLGPLFLALAQALLPVVIDNLPQLVDLVIQLLPAFTELIQIITVLAPFLLSSLGPSIGFVVDLFNTLLEVGIGMQKGIQEVFQGLIDFFTGAFTGDWGKVWKGIQEVFGGVWDTIFAIAKGVVNGIIDLINGLIGAMNNIGDAAAALFPGGKNFLKIPTIGHVGGSSKTSSLHGGFAEGTIVNGPIRALIGEDGPEAVVPLNRPLGMVDPMVRELSAIAQGKQFNGQSTSNSGATNEFHPGAIIVRDTLNPFATANAIFDRLVAKSAA